MDAERLKEIQARVEAAMPAHQEREVNSQVVMASMTQEGHDLLDAIMEKRRGACDEARKQGFNMGDPDSEYGFAYWLVRYSGFIYPTAREDIPWLLAQLAEAREREERLRNLLSPCIDDIYAACNEFCTGSCDCHDRVEAIRAALNPEAKP